MKGFPRGLILKQRHKVTRKWPIDSSTDSTRILFCFVNWVVTRVGKLVSDLKEEQEVCEVFKVATTTLEHAQFIIFVSTFGACSRPLAVGKMDTRSWSFVCACILTF